jgi:sporulation protein YunB
VNKALAEQFSDEKRPVDIFHVQKGENGAMELVQADSVQINVLMTELSMSLQKAFREMELEKYEVPLGSLLGSKIFSQMGPYINLSVVPLSVSSMDFRTEFETQGINQTIYRLYIVLRCRIKVLAPFSSEIFETENTIPVAEAVILGQVPDNFVQVPEEDILDVTNE